MELGQIDHYDVLVVSEGTAEADRARERMEETVRSSVVLAIPAAALIAGLVASSTSVTLGAIGGLLLFGNALCTVLTQRAIRRASLRVPNPCTSEAIRAPSTAVAVLAFVYFAHPLPGWLVCLPVVGLLATSLRGSWRLITVYGLGLIASGILAVLGAAPLSVVLCASTCLGLGAFFVSGSIRLEAERAKLNDIIDEVVQREREHGHAVLSAQRSSRLASVGQLAAGIAHEINNPLTYLISNIEYILEFDSKLARHQSPEDHHAIIDSGQDALEGAHRVRRIVHGIKLFARLDKEVQVADVDVNEILESSLDMARNEIRHKAELRTDFAEQLPKVRGDRGRLGQVFINLLINAAQAIPSDSDAEHAITVETVFDEEGFIAISIADTGTGIPPEKMSQIFEPFYTSKPVGEGTGLGLPIVHGIVSDAGGHINVESEVGKGTTFTVRLPTTADLTEELERTSEYSAPKEEGPKRILIIDDEPLVAKSLARMVKEAESTAVGGGDEALEVLRKNASFDVVFCDLMMPGLSGPKLYETIEREFPHLAARIIFITGGVFSDVTQSFLDQNQAHCLYKPFSIDSVRVAMTALSERTEPNSVPQSKTAY